MPDSSGADARPVVLALVNDSVGSLASLLLAAEIAATQQARLHVAYVKPPWMAWWGVSPAGIAVPAHLWAQADRFAAGQLRDKVADLLALTPPVDWTFTRPVGNVHRAVTCLVSELSPIAVVVGAPRRRRLWMRRSVARWLIGRSNVPALVIPS